MGRLGSSALALLACSCYTSKGGGGPGFLLVSALASVGDDLREVKLLARVLFFADQCCHRVVHNTQLMYLFIKRTVALLLFFHRYSAVVSQHSSRLEP